MMILATRVLAHFTMVKPFPYINIPHCIIGKCLLNFDKTVEVVCKIRCNYADLLLYSVVTQSENAMSVCYTTMYSWTLSHEVHPMLSRLAT